jgi:hypothetical protein
MHELTAVQENLEYDPLRDGPRDEAHQAEYDARSPNPNDMLGGKSEIGSSQPSTPFYEQQYGSGGFAYDEAQYHYPLPTQDMTPSGFNSDVHLPQDNPSTDYLLRQDNPSISNLDRPDQWRGKRQASGGSVGGRRRAGTGGDGMPLLGDAQVPHRDRPGAVVDDSGMLGVTTGNVPYPPTAYNQPPHGWTPPALRRMGSGMSGTSAGSSNGDLGGGRYNGDRY